MPIDANDLIALRRAFPRADHEFVRGFVYLTEEAITNRIEEVDPSWTFSVNRMENVDNNAVCHATLIIKGVARDGIGMQQILEKSGEPAKGAATDALKRCSRLFGIGRYLLDAPKEGTEFNGWLAEQQKRLGVSPAPSASLPPTQPVLTPPTPLISTQPVPVVSTSKNAPTGATNANGDFDEAPTPDALYRQTANYFNARAHFDNFWAMHSDDLRPVPLAEAVKFVQQAHWNFNAARCNDLKALAATEYEMTSAQVLEALSTACGHSVKKWRDWDGGNFTVAQGALLAWHAGYVAAHVREMGKAKDVTDAVLYAAEQICVGYEETLRLAGAHV